jgi:hypothetical protein
MLGASHVSGSLQLEGTNRSGVAILRDCFGLPRVTELRRQERICFEPYKRHIFVTTLCAKLRGENNKIGRERYFFRRYFLRRYICTPQILGNILFTQNFIVLFSAI